MLNQDVLKSYLLEMPSGHIFDLTYDLFAQAFPPGRSDAAACAKLEAFAAECNCGLVDNKTEHRYELTRR
jgi:hypothetical protein